MLLITKIYELNRRSRIWRRYVTIVDTILRFGFSDLIRRLPLNSRKRRKCVGAKCQYAESREIRLRQLLEALGPTFVKLGQMLATRPDLIPPSYAKELEKLQDAVPPFDVKEVEATFEHEFGKSVSKCFASFDHKPLAAASIGQAHRAKLRDGTSVIVKVRRPYISGLIKTDLEILGSIAEHVEKNDEILRNFAPSRVVEEFSHVLKRELNFNIEAQNARRFRTNIKPDSGVYAPRIIDEFSSTRIITMEEIKGDSARKIINSDALRAKYDTRLLAERGANSLLSQIFDDGFFHADPHPGNLFAMPGNVVAFIDFGMMGTISQEERVFFIRALNFMFKHDYPMMLKYLLKLTRSNGEKPDMAKLERDIGELVEDNLYLPLEQMRFADILQRIMDLLAEYRLELRPNLFIMFKSLMTIESLGRELDGHLQIVDLLKPFISKLKLRAYSPMRQLIRIADSLPDSAEALLSDSPAALRDILQKGARGELKLQIEHHHLDAFTSGLLAGAHFLGAAVIVAAMVIGSSLLVLSKLPPLYHDVPLLGVAGFVTAGVISLILLVKSLRN